MHAIPPLICLACICCSFDSNDCTLCVAGLVIQLPSPPMHFPSMHYTLPSPPCVVCVHLHWLCLFLLLPQRSVRRLSVSRWSVLSLTVSSAWQVCYALDCRVRWRYIWYSWWRYAQELKRGIKQRAQQEVAEHGRWTGEGTGMIMWQSHDIVMRREEEERGGMITKAASNIYIYIYIYKYDELHKRQTCSVICCWESSHWTCMCSCV